MSQKAQKRPLQPTELPPGAQDVIDTAPRRFRLSYRRAVLGKLPPRGTIKVHCTQCMGWTHEACDNRSCPLWQLSPWGDKRKAMRKGKKAT
jgi:hypothetical protein